MVTATELQRPPKHGAGSSRDAWAEYAKAVGIDVSDDDRKNDIVTAVEATDVPVQVEQEEEKLFTGEMKEVIELAAKGATELRKSDPESGTGKLRRRGQSGGGAPTASDIPYPAEVHGNDFELFSSQGFGSFIPEGTDIAPYSVDQEFIINPEKVAFLHFTKPGQNLPKKRLYNIKGIHKDGRLVQLPFEAQIQNNAGGDPEDAIGLRRYERKGIKLLLSWETFIPIYCAAWDCWAQAADSGEFVGFCTQKHAKHTLPNRYKNAGAIVSGIFGDDATTSRTWSV